MPCRLIGRALRTYRTTRFVAPLDYAPVVESVKKTGRLVLASDAVARGSFLQTVATDIQNLAFDALDAPVVVVGARNHITPAPELEDLFFPQAEWIVDAIHERILPLNGHTCRHNFTELEQIRENKRGI